jgi:hypothetical protein
MTERRTEMRIESLRILPPFAIARLGSGAPLDSYRIEVDDKAPLDWRTIVPTTTLQIDPSTGAVSREFIPNEIEFTENVNGVVKIRKVAPFLELWAVTDDDQLVPVTIDLLTQNGATPSDLSWDVAVGNRKVERRTGDPGDAVTAAATGISDHAEHRLRGTASNFVAGAGIDFGAVRYIRPTTAHPQIRFRFTPADGEIYATTSIEQNDKALRDWENAHFKTGQRVYDSTKGKGELVPVVDPRRRWCREPVVDRHVPQRDIPAVAVRDRAAGTVVAQWQRRSEPRVPRRRLRRNRRRQPRAE